MDNPTIDPGQTPIIPTPPPVPAGQLDPQTLMPTPQTTPVVPVLETPAPAAPPIMAAAEPTPMAPVTTTPAESSTAVQTNLEQMMPSIIPTDEPTAPALVITQTPSTPAPTTTPEAVASTPQAPAETPVMPDLNEVLKQMGSSVGTPAVEPVLETPAQAAPPMMAATEPTPTPQEATPAVAPELAPIEMATPAIAQAVAPVLAPTVAPLPAAAPTTPPVSAPEMVTPPPAPAVAEPAPNPTTKMVVPKENPDVHA